MSESAAPDHDEDAVVSDHDDIVPGGSKDFKCPWCPKILGNSTLLKKHIGNYHAPHSDISETKKREGSGRLSCAAKGCDVVLASYDALCRHCEEHDLELNYVKMRFDSQDEFKDWLEDIFSEMGRMVKRRGTRTTADGIIMGDFHCIFDGKKRETPSVRAPDRTPYNRRVPSKKLGFACPAYLRFHIQNGIVHVKGQLQHFGHTVQPSHHGEVTSKMSRPVVRVIGRRKRRGYTLDGSNYDEIDLHHDLNTFANGDEVEMDDDGMVNLFTVSSLEQARFNAQRSCASVDLAFREIGSIPHQNVQHLGHLIEKFHEITAAANTIEGLLKQISAFPPHIQYHSRMGDISAKRKMVEIGRQPNRKRPISVKGEVDGDEKQSLLEENGLNEEGFEHQSDHGECVYHDNTVAEEVVVDDDIDYAEDMRDRKGKGTKKLDKKL